MDITIVIVINFHFKWSCWLKERGKEKVEIPAARRSPSFCFLKALSKCCRSPERGYACHKLELHMKWGGGGGREDSLSKVWQGGKESLCHFLSLSFSV